MKISCILCEPVKRGRKLLHTESVPGTVYCTQHLQQASIAYITPLHWTRVTAPPAQPVIFSLPWELLLMILEWCDDIYTYRALLQSHSSFSTLVTPEHKARMLDRLAPRTAFAERPTPPASWAAPLLTSQVEPQPAQVSVCRLLGNGTFHGESRVWLWGWADTTVVMCRVNFSSSAEHYQLLLAASWHFGTMHGTVTAYSGLETTTVPVSRGLRHGVSVTTGYDYHTLLTRNPRQPVLETIATSVWEHGIFLWCRNRDMLYFADGVTPMPDYVEVVSTCPTRDKQTPLEIVHDPSAILETGLLHVRTFFINGTLAESGTILNGQPYGRWKGWHEDGSKRYTLTLDREGRKHGHYRVLWHAGKVENRYYIHGKRASKANYSLYTG